MTIEKTRRPLSPAQGGTIRRAVPVPLHQKSRAAKFSELSRQFDPGNFRNRKLKFRKPIFTQIRAPFIPPPAKTSKGNKFISQITKDAASDGSEEEDGKIQNQILNYEKKIDELMFEVGSLKNQVDLQKTLHDIERNGSVLETKKKMMQEHTEQIKTICGELDATSNENRVLRQNLNQMQEVAEEKKAQCEMLCSEKDKLTRKLIEVEMDGQAAGKLVTEMNLAIAKLVEENKPSMSDTASKFSRQKDALLDKLSTFESTNQTLQKMLQDRHREEVALERVNDQNRILFRKLQDTEQQNEKLTVDQFTKDRTISDLERTLSQQQEELTSVKRLQKSLEQTKGHLQRQLRTKEADCNRMAVQIQALEKQLSEMMMDNKHLEHVMSTVKDRSDKDKGYLKKATRILKQKASRTEDTVQQLNYELLHKDKEISDINTHLDVYKTRLEQLAQEKTSLLAEALKLKQQVEELRTKTDDFGEGNPMNTSRLSAMLEEKKQELKNKGEENVRLMSFQEELTTKLNESEAEVSRLQVRLKEAEETIEEYKCRVDVSRDEANSTLNLLEEQQRQNNWIQREGENELDKVKKRLQQRLLELEPLPDMLKTTELKLQDFQQQLHLSERKNSENIKLIAELTSKLEHVSELLEQVKDKNQESLEENRSLKSRINTLDRKLLEVTEQNEELLTTVSKREESIHQNNLRLEEKTQENMSVTHQLENAIHDLKQQSGSFHERVMAKERISQKKILDLECQLCQVKTEINRVKRDKDEIESRSNSRVHDLKDRLEQSQCTNRSLQNYVQFLKTSYHNVYGDMSETFLRSGSS